MLDWTLNTPLKTMTPTENHHTTRTGMSTVWRMGDLKVAFLIVSDRETINSTSRKTS